MASTMIRPMWGSDMRVESIAIVQLTRSFNHVFCLDGLREDCTTHLDDRGKFSRLEELGRAMGDYERCTGDDYRGTDYSGYEEMPVCHTRDQEIEEKRDHYQAMDELRDCCQEIDTEGASEETVGRGVGEVERNQDGALRREISSDVVICGVLA